MVPLSSPPSLSLSGSNLVGAGGHHCWCWCCCCCPGILALSLSPTISVAPCFHPTSSCSQWWLGVLFMPFVIIVVTVPTLTPPGSIPVVIHPASRGSQPWWVCHQWCYLVIALSEPKNTIKSLVS